LFSFQLNILSFVGGGDGGPEKSISNASLAYLLNFDAQG
jgi:hypothetical protein